MHPIKKIKFAVPFIILFALFGLLWKELFYATPSILPSALLGEPLPNFQLATLYDPNVTLTQKSLKGHIALLNVWATWCYACEIEQAMLVKIKQTYAIPIFSIDYKDDPLAAKKWLEEKGNPYTLVGEDTDGNVAIDLGVYGTPETFIISQEGKILYRHVGVIDQKAWDNVLYPLIKKYGG